MYSLLHTDEEQHMWLESMGMARQTPHSALARSSSGQPSKTLNLITIQAEVHFKNEQSGIN